jgi:uncharacterized surface protein with fasciclin (FAS1) repeats
MEGGSKRSTSAYKILPCVSDALYPPQLANFKGQRESRFLTLPEHCSTTIRNLSLNSLDSAINRTGIWDDLDNSPNYTCLGPTNQAFANADHPEINLNGSALATAMHMHTIPQVLYTNFLEDGQEYLSDNNLTIRVTIQGGDLYFNDAKVTNPNVM